jgi:hypothetical protein
MDGTWRNIMIRGFAGDFSGSLLRFNIVLEVAAVTREVELAAKPLTGSRAFCRATDVLSVTNAFEGGYVINTKISLAFRVDVFIRIYSP